MTRKRSLRRRFPSSPITRWCIFHLGGLLQKREQYAGAEAELDRAVALAPEMAEAYYQLGLLLHKRGEKEKGDQALARFKALRDTEYSDRAVILKQLQDTLR
jgi:tetratricopeptide (TPR) repeat protein